MKKVFRPANVANTKRVAVFASYNKHGIISDYVIYYLIGLKKVCDSIIFVADNETTENELQKLEGLCDYAQCERHEEYDFGSYKRGYNYLRDNNLLNQFDELILCNDSCYGPVFPFEEMFTEMSKRKCDFWSTTNWIEKKNIFLTSFFLVFKKQILKTNFLYTYLQNVKKENSHYDIVHKYEIPLTCFFANLGFRSSVFLQSNRKQYLLYPTYILKNYHFPLIKIRSLFVNNIKRNENPELLLLFLKKENKLLFNIVTDNLKDRGVPIDEKEWKKQQRIRCEQFSFFERIFSIHNNDYRKHIVICLFGLKLRIKKFKTDSLLLL